MVINLADGLFPPLEIENDKLTECPYIISISCLMITTVICSDTPVFINKDTMISIPQRVPTKAHVYELQLMGDGTWTYTLCEDVDTLETVRSSLSLINSKDQDGSEWFLVYNNTDIFYCEVDESNNITPLEDLYAVGADSDPMMLSMESSFFTELADVVRAAEGSTELMNSATLLDKFKTIESLDGLYKTAIYAVTDPTVLSILDGSCTEVISDEVTTVKSIGFKGCVNLVKVDFPNATEIGNSAFSGCSALSEVNLPNAITSDNYGFSGCTSLKNIDLPNLTELGMAMFSGCTSLEKLVFPNVVETDGWIADGSGVKVIDFHKAIASLSKYDFQSIQGLVALIFRSTEMSKLAYTTATDYFKNTPIANGNGYVYVPAALVNSYKTNSAWSKNTTKFRAIEDYTVDGTIMGELDWSKIETATGEQ